MEAPLKDYGSATLRFKILIPLRPLPPTRLNPGKGRGPILPSGNLVQERLLHGRRWHGQELPRPQVHRRPPARRHLRHRQHGRRGIPGTEDAIQRCRELVLN